MRAWRSLRNWVDEEAHSAKIYRRLADTATLYKEDKAGLYRDPDLQIALSWREENQPNKTWADRYYPGFEGAMAFLDESHEEAVYEEREREEARKREVAQAKALADEQRRRALAQARTAKIFKVAGACLFMLLLISLYLMNVAIESRREVSDKIFQLAARSTATAEIAITQNKLFESLAWFSDASDLSEGDANAQSYVARKVRTLLPNIPLIENVEMLSQPIVDYRLGTEGITLFSRSGNGYSRLDEFELTNKTLLKTKFDNFRSKWATMNRDGEFLAYCTLDNKLRVIDKKNDREMAPSGFSGLPKAAAFSFENDTIALATETDKTILNILELNSSDEIKPYQFEDKLRNVHVEYVNNNEIILGGNYQKSGEDQFAIVCLEITNKNLKMKYELHQAGSMTAYSISQDGKSYTVGLSGLRNKGDGISVNTYDSDTGEISNTNDEYSETIKLLTYDVTGFRLAIVDHQDNVSIMDLPTNSVKKINENLDAIMSASFSPLGTHLIVISSFNGVHFYKTGSLSKSLPGFNFDGTVLFAAFDQDEKMLLVSANQGIDSALFTLSFVNSKETIISSEMSSEWDRPYAMNIPAELWHGPKEFAYDGDEQTIVHNAWMDEDPYWMGELEGTRRVKAIEIINRPRIRFRGQMSNYLVSLLDERKNVVWEKRYLDTTDENYEPPAKLLCTIDKEIDAKYVRVKTFAPTTFGWKSISFAEIKVYGEYGFYNLTNEELFELTKAINVYELNDEGALQARSLRDLNFAILSLAEEPYFEKIAIQNSSSSADLFDSLMSRYREGNWPAFMGAYDHLQARSKHPITNYVHVLYANALLEQKQYERAYSVYTKNAGKLKNNEQANLLMLSSHLAVNSPIHNIDLENLISNYPEVSLFADSDISMNIKKSMASINSKLPAYYQANIDLDSQFYETFLIEFEIDHESDGEILSMGGKNYTDGISIKKQGNWLQLFAANRDARESKIMNVNLWSVLQSSESIWSKHQVRFNAQDRKISYWVDGHKINEVDFNGSIGSEHPPLTIGGDLDSHQYGNLKLASLKVWNKAVGENQTFNLDSLGDPIYQLTADTYKSRGQSYNVIVGKDEPTVDAYGHMSDSIKTYLEVKNNTGESELFVNCLIKSVFELRNGNYDESAKYLNYSLELSQAGERDYLQFYLASMLLEKVDDQALEAQMVGRDEAKSSNWKLDLILKKLIKTKDTN